MKKIIVLIFVFFSLKSFSQSYIVVNPDGTVAIDKMPRKIFLRVLPPLYSLPTTSSIEGDTLTFGVNVPGNGTPATFVIQPSQKSIRGQRDFVFENVPANYADYMVFKKGLLMRPVFDYITTGNTVSFQKTVTTGSIIEIRQLR